MINESGIESVVQRTEVKVVGHGHDHSEFSLRCRFVLDLQINGRFDDSDTDKCRRVSGIWMCFGGGGSYSGYGNME
jgi:hypothetical protein